MSRVPTLTTVEETIDSRFDGTAADIETGDFNGDGLTDVVITKMMYPFRQFSVDTEILLNDGQGDARRRPGLDDVRPGDRSRRFQR